MGQLAHTEGTHYLWWEDASCE